MKEKPNLGKEVKDIITGLKCETCGAQYSKKPVYDWEAELYVYQDLSGATRCFCIKHMSFYTKKGAMVDYTRKDAKVGYGARLITDILKEIR